MAASKLILLNQPTDTTKGCKIAGTHVPGVTNSPAGIYVGVADSTGAIVTSDTSTVTVAIGTNPSSGTLTGTTSVAAVNGVAVFDNLTIDNAGTGYTLTFSDGGLTSVTTNAFNEVDVIRHDVMVMSGTINGNGQYVGPYRFRGHTEDLRQNEQRISIRGTFSGTIAVIVVDPGVDKTVSANQVTIASYTTPTSQVFVAGGACDIYFLSTAWSSGTATCSVYY